MSSIDTNMTMGLEMDPKTVVLMTRFARRRRRFLWIRAIAAGLLFLIAAMVLVAVCDFIWVLPEPVRWILSFFAYGVAGLSMWWFGFRHLGGQDPRHIARQLEASDRDLCADLLSAVELADPQDANGSSTFRHRLQKAVARRAGKIDLGQLLPTDLIIRWMIGGTITLLVCSALMFVPRMQFGRRIARALLPGASIERASLTTLEILKPSPPSAFVAQGDAVGVTVKVTGTRENAVWLQWRTAETNGESQMTPRTTSEASLSDGSLDHQGVFAANLSVGSIPIEYRVIAGDAITLWHELTPLPRPRAVSFSKRYVFPEYAALPERIEESEHGDLKALVGTMAHVTVQFDQAVSEAAVIYGNQGASVAMEPVDDSDRAFVAAIPIRTSVTYQIDAKSFESGLRNPFSPQYSVTPIVDTPPTAQWDEQIPKTTIVSPLQVISLSATMIDDLPMERVVHEFQVNDDEVRRVPIAIDEPGRQLSPKWEWDLLDRDPNESAAKQLRSGDIVRMRMVAIDRKGQRGESMFIELLVAEEGFDVRRHFRLRELRQLAESVTDWINRSRELMSLMQLSAERSDWLTIQENGDEALALIEDAESVESLLLQVIAGASFEQEAQTLELIGRAVLDHRLKILAWFEDAELERETPKPRELIQRAKHLTADGLRVDQLTRATMAEFLTAALVADARSLDRSLEPLVDPENPLPSDRFPRYLAVTTGRMNEIGGLIDEMQSVLPESTLRHLEVWNRMSDQWQARFKELLRGNRESVNVNMVRDFQNQMRAITDRSMVDGRLSPTVVNLTRDLRFQIGGTGQQIFALDRLGREIKSLKSELNDATDSDDVAQLNRNLQRATARYERGCDQLIVRLNGEESLHRQRPRVDLRYAADLDLIARAVENVTEDGYAPYKEESPERVHQKLGRAFQLIEATHESHGWLDAVRALLLAERQLDDNEITKILHPSWIERVTTGLDWPARTIQNYGLADVSKRIDRVRYGEAYNEARGRITQRRWTGDPMLSAESSIDIVQQSLADALTPLEQPVLDARAIIQQYVLELSEQAREAAKEARQAEDADRSRADSEAETARELEAEQESAIEAAEKTVDALVDYANTIDVADKQERELARDADAAAASIQADVQRAKEAMQDAIASDDDAERRQALDQAADALGELAESLEQTAAHFDRAKAGENIDESRQALREAEAALQMQQQMQQPYERAEDLAESAGRTAEELMELLEQELQTNEPMQQELSDIAQQAAESAARSLENSAQQERELHQSLQRSDGAFQEQKRQLADMTRAAAQRTSTVDTGLMQAAEKAANLAEEPDLQKKLSEARKQLQAATQRVNQMGGENAVLSEIQESAAELSRAAKNAREILSEVNERSSKMQEAEKHKDDASRERDRQLSLRYLRDARSVQLRAATRENQQWSSSKNDASRRVQQAQRQKRDAEKRERQFEDRIKREPQNADALEKQRDNARGQVNEAERKEQAARGSVEFANQQSSNAKQRHADLKKQSVPQLKKDNPAAEATAAMTSQASELLREISEDLEEFVEQKSIEEDIRLTPAQAQSLSGQQSRIANDVDNAIEQLQRAARHEQRLGRPSVADQLESVANAIEQQAGQAVADASNAIEQAGENSDLTPKADADVATAAEAIQNAADDVGELLAVTSQQTDQATMSSQAAPTEGSEEQQRQGEQLARTLDDLDRALNPSQSSAAQSDNAQSQDGQPGEASSGEPQSGESQSQSASSEPGEGNPGEGEPGDSGSESQTQSGNQATADSAGQGQPTAGEASQTLADALAQEAQNAARQRAEQLSNQAQNAAQSNSQGSPSSSSDAGTEPGSGNMPNGGNIDKLDVDRLGAEWGQLRERRTEDASESRGATVASQYRREVEAYFRAIARQAAETTEQE